jgi:hypothetical protein
MGRLAMGMRSTWLGAAAFLGTVLLTATAGLGMFAASGARVTDDSARDELASELASLVQQRDELSQRVSHLEAQLRLAQSVPAAPNHGSASVAARWTEPGAAGSTQLCARLVEVDEHDTRRSTVVMLSEVCGDLAPLGQPNDSMILFESLLSDGLFVCWMDAAPRSEAPSCLPSVTTERARWSDPVRW